MAVGKIVATVIVNTSVFIEGLKKAGKRARQFGKTVRKSSNKALKEFEARAAAVAKSVPAAMAKAAAAAGAAGAAIFTALVVKGLAAVDAQAKMARTLGATQAGLVGLERAAADAGVEQGVVADEVTKLTEKLGEAMIGTGTAMEALDRLNLSAEKLSKLDVDERMAAISDAMVDGGLSTAQMAFELGELGFSSELLIVLMKGGGDAIRGATKEMEAYGVAISDVDAAKVENTNKALGRAMEVVNGLANQMAVRLAPIIEAVAVLFTDAAKESGGFGSILDAVVNGAISGIGFVLDQVSRLKFGFAGISLVMDSVRAAVFGAMAAVNEAVDAALKGVVGGINEIIRAVNSVSLIKLPELGEFTSQFTIDLRQMADTAEEDAQRTREALEAMAREPLPSEALEDWVRTVRIKSFQAAFASVEAHKKQNEENAALTTEAARKEAEAAAAAAAAAIAAQQKAMQARFDLIRGGVQTVTDFIRTETEVEQSGHLERLQQLNDAHAFMLISDQDFMAARERLEEGHTERLNDIKEKAATAAEKFNALSWDAQTTAVVGALGAMAQSVGTESRAMFAINKAGSIASAAVNTFTGATKAFAQFGGGPLGFAMAAAVTAAGLANIAKIKAQTFGGGASGGGGGGAAPALPAGGAGGGGTLTVQGLDKGSLFTGDVVADIAEELLQFQREGGQVILA